MKKQFYLKGLLSLLLLFVGINASWAAYEVVATCDFTSKSVSHNAYGDTWNYGDFSVCHGSNNNGGWAYIKLGAKSANLENPNYIATTKGMSDNLSKITVSIPAGSLSKNGMSVTSWGVKVYSDSGMQTEYDYVAGGTISAQAGTFDFSPSQGKTWDKSYRYVVTFTFANTTTTNGIVLVDKITYYKYVDSGKTTTTTTFPENSYTAYIGEPFTAPTATVTGGEGLVPTYSSSKTDVATIDANTGAVTLVAPGTTTITASYAGNDTYESSNASYTLTVGKAYASLAALVADGTPTITGIKAKLTLTDEVIQDIALNADGTSRLGIWLKSGEQEVEIYKYGVPTAWSKNGTVSGTIVGDWKLYSSTWELVIDNWNQLTYTAPAVQKETPTITLTYQNKLFVGQSDVYSVTYTGDGTVSAVSSDTEVATANYADGKVTISAKKTGTAEITITASETDAYYAPAPKKYTLTVLAAATLPFAFDGGKSDIPNTTGMSQTGLGDDYSSSPKLKFDGNGDNVIVAFNAQAKYLQYFIKGKPSSGETWEGIFDVQESANGTDYTSVKSYTTFPDDACAETYALNSTSRFVKFVFTTKTKGNVALGAIMINNVEPTTVTISDVKYATYYNSEDAYIMPEGLTGYIFHKDSKKIVSTYAAGSKVPAGEGLVLNGEAKDYKLFATTTSTAKNTNNLLKGSDAAATTTGGDKYYMLSLNAAGDANSVGFYYGAADGAAFTNGAHKAYLALTTAQAGSAKGFPFNDDYVDETTGINEVSGFKSQVSVKYLENGQIVIVKNGKKYNVNGQALSF